MSENFFKPTLLKILLFLILLFIYFGGQSTIHLGNDGQPLEGFVRTFYWNIGEQVFPFRGIFLIFAALIWWPIHSIGMAFQNYLSYERIYGFETILFRAFLIIDIIYGYLIVCVIYFLTTKSLIRSRKAKNGSK